MKEDEFDSVKLDFYYFRKFGSHYFELVSEEIRTISSDATWADQVRGQLKQSMMDVDFLRLFCLCLEIRYDSTSRSRADEKTLRSIIIAHQMIWAKEDNALSIPNRLKEIQDHDFHSVNFELEGKIHQSKLQIEGWCGIFLRSTNLMKYRPSSISGMCDFLRGLKDDQIDILKGRARESVALRKQIDILEGKIEFLIKSLDKIEHCTESEEIIELLNFARAFSNKAACLACLFWAKEANEVTDTEMNIAHFDMMHEFVPCAPDVTSCYFGILLSENLQPSDPIVLEEIVASFVDFFFEHLSNTTLKNDFLIFRERMIVLFTFLAYHPHEYHDEDEVMRSQIYALFGEDVYLLLPLDHEINKDFMIKFEIANAKARQLYYGLSDSWIGLGAEKMDHIYFVSVQREVYWIEKHARWALPVQSQLWLYRMELRFLRASLPWLATWYDTDEEIKVIMSSMIISLKGIWGKEKEKGLLAARLYAIRRGDIADWHPLAIELEGKIQLSKLEFEAWLVNLFHWSFRRRPLTSNKIVKLLDYIHDTLNDLVDHKADKIAQFKKQIQTLKEKLVFLQNLLKLTENCKDTKELGEFSMFVQVFANDASCLTFLCWAKEANDKSATEINLMLSHMLQKIKPVMPDVARLYFGTFKAIYLQRSDSLLFGQTASVFVDFFLEDPVTLFKDDFKILRDDVIFLLTFLNDPPNGNVEEVIRSQIDHSFWEDFYGLLPIDDMKGDFSDKKVLLSEFMMKIKTLNAKIQKLYCQFPDSSLYHLPKITPPWYLAFLIQNLRNLKERMITDRKFVLFAKYKILKFEEELVSLSPFFNYIFELQNELNDTWLQVVDLVHLTERVINSCISSWFVFDHPIWYYMAYLSDVFDRLKIVKRKLEKIKENNMYNVRCLPRSAGVIGTLSKQAWTSELNEVVVGFEDEAKKITDNLTRGHKSLDIVSIVGMGGLGKTTLAKKVSSLVKDQFHILAFCSVSQDHNTRMLLLDILKYIIKVDDEITRMTDDDLAHKLWKCLSRQKYLILLDDVWSISVWNKVKGSFPDDQNGSRVIITTRSYEVAHKCKIQCSPLHLRFLSKVESWQLLHKKVFQNGISPPNISNIGRLIAESCKGLPLAIVVIAGLLARIEKSESSWGEIAEKVVAYLFDEGCTNILELSYNHLPEYLKPCLLYLGAFPEDKLIRVKHVILLWIAEGFVQESETNSIEDVAKEYFHDLVDRSLIIVSARSSSGEIKTFYVHDLIHDLCQRKCHKGNFFMLGRGIAESSSSFHSMYDHYRVSTVAGVVLSSLSNPSTLLFLKDTEVYDLEDTCDPNLTQVQVLYVEDVCDQSVIEMLPSQVNLRHFKADNISYQSIPSSISNLWNIQSLILSGTSRVILPDTLWKMKSLRHVKVEMCSLRFSDGHEQLDKVVSFSSPDFSTEKDVKQLLQRLPAVRKLRIYMRRYPDSDERVETLDFYRKLESLELELLGLDLLGRGNQSPYLINFPSTLKKLTLDSLRLPLTIISAIAELHCLRVLKLRWTFFWGRRLKMEDVAFNCLVFFELVDWNLVQWYASAESFPCLEQLSIQCRELEELPPCFGEISTLKRIDVLRSSKLTDSAFRIREEQMDLGNKVDVTIDADLWNKLKLRSTPP